MRGRGRLITEDHEEHKLTDQEFYIYDGLFFNMYVGGHKYGVLR